MVKIWPWPSFVPWNGKIADITHADTNKHTVDLIVPLGENRQIIAVIISAVRMSGTGNFLVYPNEETGDSGGRLALIEQHVYFVAAGTQRIQYNLSVASDDFDLYCWGYITQ